MMVRTLVCALAAATAMSLAPASRPAVAADTQEEMRDAEQPAVLRVGATRELKRPSAAAQIARDGDTIEIDAGIYDGDAAVWRQHRLTIRGLGGRAHLRANGAHAEGKAIWVIKGNDTTIESVEFSGAKVSDQNGAGIRLEGAGLTVRECYFHNNENGILAGANQASDIVVEHSEFTQNGAGDGYSHNLYVGNVRSFTLRFSYVHHALVGHNVMMNDRPAGGRSLFVRAGTDSARIVNNVFSGRGVVLNGPGELENNVVSEKTAFVDPAGFDYRLRAGAAAIGRGVDPGSAHGFELRPTMEYAHKTGKRSRGNSGKLDAGAFEYQNVR